MIFRIKQLLSKKIPYLASKGAVQIVARPRLEGFFRIPVFPDCFRIRPVFLRLMTPDSASRTGDAHQNPSSTRSSEKKTEN
jgi:hypothetical protein